MKGTEKQIAWAEDLKAKAIAALEWMRENPSDASKLIDVLRFVNFNGTPDQVGMAVVSQTNRYLK